MFEDKIEIKLEVVSGEDGYTCIDTTVLINNTPINQFSEFTEFMLSSKDNRSYHNKKWEPSHKQLEESSFFPFTCSCGIAGCASIWDGIYSKHRKHSVEWRIPSDSGYERFLDKTFYSFSKLQYENEIAKCWKFIEDNKGTMLSDELYDNDEKVPLGENYKWLFKEEK